MSVFNIILVFNVILSEAKGLNAEKEILRGQAPQNDGLFRARSGFSLAGLMVLLLMASVAMMAMAPLMTQINQVKTNTSMYVTKCIENSESISSRNCQGAIKGLANDMSKDYETVYTLLETPAYVSDALAVARQACDLGGERACRILMDVCVKDDTLCDVADNDNDLAYYLRLDAGAGGAGRNYIEFLGIGYYEKAMPLFVSQVDTVCLENPDNTACAIAQYTIKTVNYEFYQIEEAQFTQQDDTITDFIAGSVVVVAPEGTPIDPETGAPTFGTFCWGLNDKGGLGDNDEGNNKDIPTRVYTTDLPGNYSQIAGGVGHTCAISSDTGTAGQVFCWGNNGSGQIGDDDQPNDKSIPTAVQTTGYPQTYKQITTGGWHTCAISADTDTLNQLYCWGANGEGQLGINDSSLKVDDPSSVYTTGLPQTYSQVSAGWQHTCAISADTDTLNQLYCWGNNEYGQLGDNDAPIDKIIPTRVYNVNLPQTYSDVSLGKDHTCAISADKATEGRIYCWGGNADSQLGDNDQPNDKDIPTAVYTTGLPKKYSQLSAGVFHNCAISAEADTLGKLYCWGENQWDQLGDDDAPNDKAIPTAVTTTSLPETYAQVSAGQYHTCAISSDADTLGQVYCWGENEFGQLGDNDSPNDKTPPTPIYTTDLPGTYSLLATRSIEHMCAIKPETWIKELDINNEDDQIQSIEFDDSGNIYLGGSYGTTGPYFIIKYNAALEEQWRTLLRGSGGTYNSYVFDMKIDSTGVYYVGREHSGCVMGKLDLTTGAYDWADDNVEFDDDMNYCTSLAIDDNYMYAVGDAKGGGSHLFKLNKSDGQLAQPIKRIYASDIPDHDQGTVPGNLIKADDVFFYAEGARKTPSSWVYSMNAEEGGWLVRAEDNVPSTAKDKFLNSFQYGIALDSNYVYFSGRYDDDNYIAALSVDNGSVQWEKTFVNSNGGAGIQIDTNGNFYVSQSGKKDGTNFGSMLTKYDSDFNKIWELCFDSTVSYGPLDLILKGDYLYLAYPYNDYDTAIVKVHKDGTHQWTRVPNGYPRAFRMESHNDPLHVDNNGNIYILGNQNNNLARHWLTKINSSGTYLWSKEIQAFDDDNDSSIELGDNNIIYYAGRNKITKFSVSDTEPYITRQYVIAFDELLIQDLIYDSSEGHLYVLASVTTDGSNRRNIVFMEIEDTGSAFNVLWAYNIFDGDTSDENYPKHLLLDSEKKFLYFNFLDDATDDQFIGKISTSLASNFTPVIGTSSDETLNSLSGSLSTNTLLVTPATNTVTTSYSQTISVVDTSAWDYGDLGSLTDFSYFHWQVAYDNMDYEEFVNVKIGPNGYLYAYGEVEAAGLLVKFNPSDGTEIWRKELGDFYPNQKASWIIGYRLTMIDFDPSGNIYLLGQVADQSAPCGEEDIVVAMFTESGVEPNTTLNFQWGRALGTSVKDDPKEIKYKDGYLYIVGAINRTSYLSAEGMRGLLMRIDANQNANSDFTVDIGNYELMTPIYPLTDTPSDPSDDMQLVDPATVDGDDTYTVDDFSSSHVATLSDFTSSDICGIDDLFSASEGGATGAPDNPACGATTLLAADTGLAYDLVVSNCNIATNPSPADIDPGGTSKCWYSTNEDCTGTGCGSQISGSNYDKYTCTYDGAVEACEALNNGDNYGEYAWRLPEVDELKSWRETPESDSNLIIAAQSLDLCYQGVYNPICGGYGCSGAYAGICYPFYLWAASPDGSSYYGFKRPDSGSNQNWSGPEVRSSDRGLGVRCVRKKADGEAVESDAYVTTTDTNHIGTKLKSINSITISETDPDGDGGDDAAIRWMVCFSGVDTCNSSNTWYYYNGANWVTSNIASFSKTTGSTKAQIQDSVATMPFIVGDTLDFAFWIYVNSNAGGDASVESVAVQGVFAK